TVEAYLSSEEMRQRGLTPFQVSTGNTKDLAWTFGQMLVRHTEGGCPLEVGDIIASGTVSGPSLENAGCFLERTWDGVKGSAGRTPLILPTGEQRIFLNDGDEVLMTAYCTGDGYRIGLGSVSGLITAAAA